ncbi:hypothetical protein EB061_10400, partial [bacterium]|nr:hypothetical protein [bacterium]
MRLVSYASALLSPLSYFSSQFKKRQSRFLSLLADTLELMCHPSFHLLGLAFILANLSPSYADQPRREQPMQEMLRQGPSIRRYGLCSYNWMWKQQPKTAILTTTYTCDRSEVIDDSIAVSCAELKVNHYLITQLAPRRAGLSHRLVRRYQPSHGPQRD